MMRSGAVVANASVTVTNVNTGIVTKVVSSSSGDYEVPSLRVGIYTIEAEATGFRAGRGKEHHHRRGQRGSASISP